MTSIIDSESVRSLDGSNAEVYESGVYVAGIDLPIGSYVIRPCGKQASFKVYAKYKDYLAGKAASYMTVQEGGCYYSLREDGIVLVLTSCNIRKTVTYAEKKEMQLFAAVEEEKRLYLEAIEDSMGAERKNDEINEENEMLSHDQNNDQAYLHSGEYKLNQTKSSNGEMTKDDMEWLNIDPGML